MPRQLHIEKMDDRDLLELFYAGHNNDLLGILLERYALLVLGVCMKYLKDREEAKDAAQQVFLKVIVELRKYKVDYFKSWLYMVAKNHCLMQLRKKGIPDAEINEKLLSAAEEDTNAVEAEKSKTLENLAHAISTLNAEQQKCISLFFLEKKSYHEIALLIGYDLMQVKSHIQNGKRNLRNLMKMKSLPAMPPAGKP